MNRLVLIGNGFDLAHGLKTSYKNFIFWYWDQWGYRLTQSWGQAYGSYLNTCLSGYL